ncbi:CIA30 family protein [Algibacter sp. AS12]|uniref:CIA30 family protein n=1 Tax=Algibacter sp. AS12 TaxID=3135773 RepID=UPI00398B0B3B
MTLINFTAESDSFNWKTVDDNVMGGKSEGAFKINVNGNGLFYGEVSLENNGGFSMVKYPIETLKTASYSKFCINLKGDGKTYQFRVKTFESDNHSYIYPFKTTTCWETIEIPFIDMYANFRGKKLELPNFEGNQIEMIAFLIGNKKAEAFNLEIGSISLR